MVAKQYEGARTLPSRIAVSTRSEEGRIEGATCNRFSRRTKNATGSRREEKFVVSAGVDLKLETTLVRLSGSNLRRNTLDS